MRSFYLKLLLLFSIKCSAQTDTVDHFWPYLVSGEGKIVENYSWNKPLRRDDTIRYKLIVEPFKSLVTIKDTALDITFGVALTMDAYGLWVEADTTRGGYWEIYDTKFRRVRDLGITILKIDEIPRLINKPYQRQQIVEDNGESEIIMESYTYDIP